MPLPSAVTSVPPSGEIDNASDDRLVILHLVIVDRLADSLNVRETVADALPGPDIIGGAVTAVVQDRVTDAVAEFAQSDPEPDPSELWTDVYRETAEAAE